MTHSNPFVRAAALAAILSTGLAADVPTYHTFEDAGDAKSEGDDDSTDPQDGERETFDALKTKAQAIIDGAKQEDRELSDDEKEKFEGITKKLRRMKDANDREADLAKLDLQTFGNTNTKKARDLVTSAPKLPDDPGAKEPDAKEKFERDVAKFETFVRTGERPDNYESFTITTGVNGGVLVPRRIGSPMVVKRTADAYRQAIAARGFSPIQTDSTAEWKEPLIDDTANTSEFPEAENDRTEKEAEPAITSITLGAPLHRSKAVWFSNTQLATQTNLMSYIEPQLYRRVDRQREANMTTKILANATQVVTGAATDGITYLEILQVKYTVPRAHRESGVFIISDQLALAIQGLTDNQGRPLYVASIKDGELDRLAGWPVFVADSLPDPAANNKTLIAASAEALRIRDVTSGAAAQRMARYAELPDHPDQVGMELFENGDENFHDPFVAVFQHAAA
ncbi:MAG: phage major capsid protein [Planctomycetota bacterium]